MFEQNKIGKGGFGSVYKGKWHGEDAAMKCILIGQMKDQYLTEDLVSDFEKTVSEYRVQLSTPGSGILMPQAMIRQQNQQKENGKWIAMNYNVYIYPLFDCNLFEFHNRHFDQFTDRILADILDQCLTKKKFRYKE